MINKYPSKSFPDFINGASEVLSGNDRDFFIRVYQTSSSVYQSRLRAIGFHGYSNVLDAGTGFGQWAVELSKLNTHVHAIDYSEIRIQLLENIRDFLDLHNLTCSIGSIEEINAPDSSYDAIFCYSVIFFSDYRKTLSEFARVLKPGGRVYICANGLGWYLHNIVSGHNSTTDFDARIMGLSAIQETFEFFETGKKQPGSQLIISGERMKSELNKNGFTVEALAGEGQYSMDEAIIPKPFFQGQYCNAEGVYEIVARKQNN